MRDASAPAAADAAIASESEVVVQEIRKNNDNGARHAVERSFAHTFGEGSALGHPITGTEAQVRAIAARPATVRDFWATHYRPGNMRPLVGGSFTPAQEAAVLRMFAEGGIGGGAEAPERPRFRPRDAVPGLRIVTESVGQPLRQAHVVHTYGMPTPRDHATAFVDMSVIANAVGGDPASYLFAALRGATAPWRTGPTRSSIPSREP